MFFTINVGIGAYLVYYKYPNRNKRSVSKYYDYKTWLKKTLKFNNIRVNKNKFHMSKKAVDLMSVNVNKIVVSDKFNHNEDGFKYFIGYKKGEILKPLCIILPQMSGYIKYFKYGSPTMSFLIKDDEVWEKYEQIWDVIKNKLGIKFHSEPVYEYRYLKAKVREFDGVIKTNFLGNDVPKENMHYTCIACITIDSVMKMDEKYFSQVYLEECKYKIKKIQMSRFINAELDSDSDSDDDSESDSESDDNSVNDSDNDSDNYSK